MKKEKKIINVLTAFFISHKSDVKNFLKWILKQYHTALVNINNAIHFIKNVVKYKDYLEGQNYFFEIKINFS